MIIIQTFAFTLRLYRIYCEDVVYGQVNYTHIQL